MTVLYKCLQSYVAKPVIHLILKLKNIKISVRFCEVNESLRKECVI